MCGIAALFFYPALRPPEMVAEMRTIFTHNLLQNEERGNSATGLVIVQRDGTFATCKQPICASEFVRQPEYVALLDQLSEHTTCLLGHTRNPTKGSPANAANNHPLIADTHIGVHNGTITNDDALFQRLHLPRCGQVDSEVIFRLFQAISPGNKQYPHTLAERAMLLQGTFATISLDLRDPQGIVVTRHHKPLCMHYHAPWQAIIFSSRYLFLRKTFGKAVTSETLPNTSLCYFHGSQPPSARHAPLATYHLQSCASAHSQRVTIPT